jgi:5-methylcytosine-specific restriction protein A
MLVIGQIYTAKDYCNEFKCGCRSGMNYSKTTKSMVIITKANTTAHNDFWIDDVLHYTGQGRLGDQKLTRSNKRLSNANRENTKLYIFQLVNPNEYIYKGEAELINIYDIKETDDAGNLRKVYKFELKLK